VQGWIQNPKAEQHDGTILFQRIEKGEQEGVLQKEINVVSAKTNNILK